MSRDAAIAADLELEAVTSAVSLDGLARDWGDLWARCPDATPFQAPEWLIPWWRAFGNGELRVLAFRQHNRLVGLVPLYVGACDDGSGRVVRLLGSGNSDYLDALVEPGLEDAIVATSFRHLQARRDRWDRCDLLELRQESPLLRSPAPAGWHDEIVAGSACSFVRIDRQDPDTALPDRLRAKLRYYRRYAERRGTVRVERADAASLDEALEALFRLHGARWRARGGAGLLTDPAVQSFHRSAAPALLRRGMLRLHTLYVDGQESASCYTLVHRERTYFYLAGFDPAFRKLSPGHLVVHHALQETARGGGRIFDLLRGQETYKQHWNATGQENRMRRLRHRAAAPERRVSSRHHRSALTRTARP